MNKISFIQSLFKGISFYLPKERSNLILRALIFKISEQKDLIKHFFIYFDNRFECRFRLFIHSELSIKEIEKLLYNFLEPYIVQNQTFGHPKQLFKSFEPYSIIPIAYIEYSDEIYVLKNNVNFFYEYLENLTILIVKKSDEIDFENENQKLEFVLELLLSSLAFFDISSKQLLIFYKESLKYKPKLNNYLENTYGKMVEENKENVLIFRKTLMNAEQANDLLNVFWKNNKIRNYKELLRLIFKVLNITSEQQSYCLFVLHKTSDDLANL